MDYFHYMNFKLEVPVTPLVKKWLIRKYGKEPALSTKTAIGISLTYMINKHNRYLDKQVSMSNYSERIIIRMSADVFFRYGHTLTPTAVCHFNKYVLEEIYGIMFYGIDIETSMLPNRQIKDCIESFCDRYDFNEEEFSYERAKKAYYRYRERKDTVPVL